MSEACCEVLANLHGFILEASLLNETLKIEFSICYGLFYACDDISDRVVDEATYVIILVISIQRTFLTLEKRWHIKSSSLFGVHLYPYFLPYTKLKKFWPYPCLARLALCSPLTF